MWRLRRRCVYDPLLATFDFSSYFSLYKQSSSSPLQRLKTIPMIATTMLPQNEEKNRKQDHPSRSSKDEGNNETKDYRYTKTRSLQYQEESPLGLENSTFILSPTKSLITQCQQQQQDEGSDSSRPSSISQQPTPFPWKLHDLLDDGQETEIINAAISWLPSGKGFRIHNRTWFTEYVLPRYFQIQYKSFIRQLNIYGFKRDVSCGDGKGSYTHDFLMRGQPSLCRNMKRTKIKKKGNGETKQQELKNGGREPPAVESYDETSTIKNPQQSEQQPKNKCSREQPPDAEEEPNVFDETQMGCSIINVKEHAPEAILLKTCFPHNGGQNQQSTSGTVDYSTTMPSPMLEVTSEHESMLHETRSISITHDVETAIIDIFFGGTTIPYSLS
jgi:hypothetical protein